MKKLLKTLSSIFIIIIGWISKAFASDIAVPALYGPPQPTTAEKTTHFIPIIVLICIGIFVAFFKKIPKVVRIILVSIIAIVIVIISMNYKERYL